jgi:hypothetical protein
MRASLVEDEKLRFEIHIQQERVTDDVLREMARLMKCLKNPKRPVILVRQE